LPPNEQTPVRRTLVTRPIQDIQVGQRVLADNPELNGQAIPQAKFDAETTRLVVLHQIKPDGHELTVETLLPLDALAAAAMERLNSDIGPALDPIPLVGSRENVALNELLVGQTLELNMPELGAAGPAEIVTVRPCPAFEPDDGTGRRLITSVFRHAAANVIDLSTAGSNESIGVTTNHPFWSEDRRAFIPAGALQQGENLRRADGTLTQVARITPRTGPPVPVFNFEVDGQHVYSVSADGLIVHNTCHPNDAASTLLNHGYVIFNKITGENYKVGISSTVLNGGLSSRALGQLDDIAAAMKVAVSDLDHVVVNSGLAGRGAALVWEKQFVGFLKKLGSNLPASKRPIGQWP